MAQDRFEEIAKVISGAGGEKEIEELFAKSEDETIAWFKSKGCEVTKEDLRAFAEKMNTLIPENGELSEDALENVAGGMVYFWGGHGRGGKRGWWSWLLL